MKMRFGFAGAAALLLGACASVPPVTDQSDVDRLVAGNAAFGVDLYHQLKGKDGNIFISPASISTAFGLIYPGAEGETSAEIARVMHFNLPKEEFHPAMGQFLAGLQSDDETHVLKINNSGWFDQSRVVEEDYLAVTRAHYDVGDTRVDFIGQSEKARWRINEWVEKRTNDRIRNLLGPDDVGAETRFVLVNTIFFEADWQSPFTTYGTGDRAFHLSQGEAVDVEMMHQQATFRYWDNRRVQIVELPYTGNKTSMIVILPKETEGLARLEDRLTAERLNSWLDQLSSSTDQLVDLQLPKLKMEDKYKLKAVLEQDLGLRLSFTNQANFNAMVGPARQPDGEGVKLDEVIHQTFLEIDEHGTEAAAATALAGVRLTSSRRGYRPPVPIPVHVDHPYWILLKDNETGALLFFGRINDPRADLAK